MIKYIALFFLLMPYIGHSLIKSTGTPYITNYLKSDHHAGTQNWGIASDQNGFIYFANNDGLLSFDGTHWEITEISNFSALRSICIDKKNTIYVGTSNDFGFISKPLIGEQKYVSLRHLLPPDIGDFAEIWRIFDTPFGIIFQSYSYLFILKDESIEVIKPNHKFQFAFSFNDRLFITEPGYGLYEYYKGSLHEMEWAKLLQNYEICTLLPLNEHALLIGTSKNGMFKFENNQLMEWKTKANSFLIQNNLFCATQLKSDNYAFGTVLGGVAICNAKGDILQEINHKTGLQNNTILSIFSDNSENLWLGLDNGIAYVEISSPVSLISDIANMGTGYTCQIFENYLYLGTNQGLFVKPFSSLSQNEGIFELVENTEGQVWSLNVFDNQLICCHDRGVFAISGKKSRQLWNKAGTWKFIPLKNHSNKLLGGCYDGLVMLKKGENGWLFDKKIKGFSESTRFISNSEDESIWVSHGEKGLFHIRLNNQLDSVIQNEFYTSTNGLPSNSRNIVFKLKNDIFVSTISGFYAFNSDKKKFEPSEKYNALFGITGRLKSFSIDVSNNIWYIAENESGVLRLNENSTYTKISDPFKRLNNQYVEEFEFIYPYNEENIFLGIQTGFAHYSSKFIKSYNQKFDSFITKIELPYLDSTIYFNQVQNAELKHKFPFRKNAFRFHFTSNFLENTENLQFSYFLENYSDDWSVWSTIPFKDFTNLDPEHYTLKLKAQNTYNTISEISSFSFTITPPWYRSYWAWISYLLLGFFIVLINFRIFKTRMQHAKNEEIKKLEEKRLHDEEQFERKRMMDEKELIFLRNEKLRQEMLHRDKELANQAMNIIQKNKSFQKLNEELLRIQNATDDGLVKTKMVLLRKRIEKEIDEEQQNQIFETYFDEVHSDFSERLKEKYPQLSPKDIRLCAYIRMDMSTKEISSLFNISYRGAEINRYRLRKKLDLSREVNLPTFLSNI